MIYTIDIYRGGSLPKSKRKQLTPAETVRAKVFWTGRSQAVRLPKAFRVAAQEVLVRRDGKVLVLEPLDLARDEKGWPLAFWALAGAAPGFDVGDRPLRHERDDTLRR